MQRTEPARCRGQGHQDQHRPLIAHAIQHVPDRAGGGIETTCLLHLEMIIEGEVGRLVSTGYWRECRPRGRGHRPWPGGCRLTDGTRRAALEGIGRVLLISLQ
jgi:hypothetical protein